MKKQHEKEEFHGAVFSARTGRRRSGAWPEAGMGKLNKEEAKISQSYGRGEWKPIKNRKAEARRYQYCVRDALQYRNRVKMPDA